MSRLRIFDRPFSILALGLSLMLAGTGAAIPAADPNPATQTILFIADDEPIFVEFRLSVESRPFTEAWRSGLTELVNELDKDRDGVLSRTETDPATQKQAAAIAQKPVASEPLLASALLQTPNLWDADAEPRDGKLKVEEIAEFLMRQGRGPFQTQAAESGALVSPQATATNNSGQRLWDLADQDGSGQLSPKELRLASAALMKHDLDADETISLIELESEVNPFFSAGGSNQTLETPFFPINRGQSSTRVVRRLMQRYGLGNAEPKPPIDSAKISEAKENAKPLERTPHGIPLDVLKIPKSQRSLYDRDGSGSLDEWEMRAYLKAPIPEVRIDVQLPASDKSAAKLTGTTIGNQSKFVVKTLPNGSVSILAGDMQMELDAGGQRPGSLMQALEARFNQADGDNNGYLENNEANRDLFFRQHFKKYDVDSDGKLYPNEWKPAVASAINLAKTQTRMLVQYVGKDVFSVLDSDRNLRISPREWQLAADRMRVWDQDGNGTLEKTEVPEVYRLSFGPGLPDLPSLSRPQNNNSGSPLAPQVARGPKWFQAMDKNQDGDVSAREFLGKPELFRQLDQDNNNLIDPREAAQLTK